jgi:Protein of unknown function DUF58
MTEAAATRRLEVEFRWGASPLTTALATCSAVAICLGLATSQWQLVVFAAPMLGVLCSIGRQPRTPRTHVCVQAESVGFFEQEHIQLSIWETDANSASVELAASAVTGMTIGVVEQDSDRLTVMCTAERWGRYPIRAHLTATTRGGLIAGTATLDAVQLYVFPLAPARSTAIPRTELPDRIGTHVGRRVGSGIEYANIRAYMPGDPLRAVNWPVSARRRSLHVTDPTQRAGHRRRRTPRHLSAAPWSSDRGHRTNRARNHASRANRAQTWRSRRNRCARRSPPPLVSARYRTAAVLSRARYDTRCRHRISIMFHRAPSSSGFPPCSIRTSRRHSSTSASAVTSW